MIDEKYMEQALVEFTGAMNDWRMKNYEYNCIRSAPHVVENARVFLDGNMWCCLKGDDIQSGVCGFGETPEKACSEFDNVWTNGDRPK